MLLALEDNNSAYDFFKKLNKHLCVRDHSYHSLGEENCLFHYKDNCGAVFRIIFLIMS